MEKIYINFKTSTAMLVAFLFGICALQAQVTTQTITYSGSVFSYTVPSCVGTLTVDLRGAAGGNGYVYYSSGGNGGRVTAAISVTPGQVLNFNIGGAGGNAGQGVSGTGGFNGGGLGASYPGNYGGGGGGGATDIRVSPYALANRVVVA